MNLVEMLQEGGLGAYAALGLGVLGALLGFIAIASSISRSKAGFSLGIVTLITAALTALVGIAGTMGGRAQMQNALAYVENKVDAEHILLAGWAEAANASLIGFFAALLPFMLGGAAAVLGVRAVASNTLRIQGEPQVDTGDNKTPRLMMVAVVEGIALLCVGGAWVVAHQEPPPGKYNFARNDSAWRLASDIEAVSKEPARACQSFEETLNERWPAADKNEWPRVIDVPPSLAEETKRAARTCVEYRLEKNDDVAALLTSPLLMEDELREKVRTHGAIPSLPPPSTGSSLDKETIRKVVSGARKAVQNCYERALKNDPKLSGKVMIEFTIGGRGDVTEANASEGTTIKSAEVVSCVREAIERLKFPAPEDGEPVTVNYPFVLSPAE
ncbi:MAG: AgmX/PglI C-terminal domain-containing protein [Archangium sp.]